jgi:hypothetical protein
MSSSLAVARVVVPRLAQAAALVVERFNRPFS